MSLGSSWKKISVISEKWKLGLITCERGVFGPRAKILIRRSASGIYCPEDAHMEEEVQLRVQVEEEDRRNTRKGTRWESKNGQPHDVDDNVDDMKRAPTHS